MRGKILKKNNVKIKYVILSFLFMAAGILLTVVFCLFMFGGRKHARLKTDCDDMIERAAYVIGDEDVYKTGKAKVEAGLIEPGEYVISVLTGSDYLLKNRDDKGFAEDLLYVLYDTDGFDDGDVNDLLSDLADSSRRDIAAKYIMDFDAELLSANRYDGDFTSVYECQLTKDVFASDDFAVGIRKGEGYFKVSGDELRTDFFVDGVLYRGAIKYEPADDGSTFVLAFDTAGIVPGEHDVSILIRTSDGRGRIIDGGHVVVPEYKVVNNNDAALGSLLASQNEAWYMLDAGDGNAYINFVGLSGDIKVSLYDMYGNELGTNDAEGTDFEVLRGLKQDVQKAVTDTGIEGLSNVFYFKVTRGASCTTCDDVIYTMVQSREVAYYNDCYMAVTGTEGYPDFAVPTPLPTSGINQTFYDYQVTLADGSGSTYDVKAGEVKFLPINGFMTSFIVRDGGTGSGVNFCPVFESETMDYAYCAPAGAQSLSITVSGSEGVFGTSVITNHSKTGEYQAEQGERIELGPGENEITIDMRSVDGQVKTYTLYVLYGDDSGDFCESTLSSFPTSYHSGLWLLHSLHPNYQFRAYNTGLDYTEVLNNEDHLDRSLANVYSHPNWVVPSSPMYDGGGWMQADRNVVNYYLDPRNSLTPENIFSFELLSFDSTAQTIEGVRSIISGSFMDDPSTDFAQIIYNAGQTAGVSPYFIASRILQEMGYNGESALCHGTLEGYEGYYNFYNIGSTPDPSIENGALINGARYAMWGQDPDGQTITDEEASLLLPWDNIEDAITGGALWIASRYTDAGQDSLYFQKFDVIDNTDGLYLHQYAQNISMAYTEGARYYSGYVSIGMADSSFTFTIPVYLNMPETYGYLPEPY